MKSHANKDLKDGAKCKVIGGSGHKSRTRNTA
jgi:hypothetical protein